jgi:excisionase family DNA binding protein
VADTGNTAEAARGGNENYLTVPEAAQYLGVSRQAVQDAIKRGRLPASKISARRYLIHKDDVALYQRQYRGRKGWSKRQPFIFVPSGTPDQLAAVMVPFLSTMPMEQLRGLLLALLRSGVAEEERITRAATEGALRAYLKEVWDVLPSELQQKWEAVEQAVQQDMQASGGGDGGGAGLDAG